MKKAILIIGLFFLLFSGKVYSAEIENSLTVEPSTIHLDLSRDEPFTTVLYTNHSDHSVFLTFDTSDFTEGGNNYSLRFLQTKEEKNSFYGLSSWILFDRNSMVLAPGQTEALTITINKEELPAGGHYAAVLATIQPDSLKNDITMQGVLTTLVFVRTATGREREQAVLQGVAVNDSGFGFPDSVSFRLQNQGNVQVIPHGTIVVSNMFHQIVTRGVVNIDSLIILPESLRVYKTNLVKPDGVLIPGLYTVKLELHYGKSNQPLSSKTTFFSFGNISALEIVIFIGIIVGLFVFFRKRTRL